MEAAAPATPFPLSTSTDVSVRASFGLAGAARGCTRCSTAAGSRFFAAGAVPCCGRPLGPVEQRLPEEGDGEHGDEDELHRRDERGDDGRGAPGSDQRVLCRDG